MVTNREAELNGHLGNVAKQNTMGNVKHMHEAVFEDEAALKVQPKILKKLRSKDQLEHSACISCDKVIITL